MPIGVPRIIYCWGEELPAQWTDIYNFIFRRRMVFLMQYLDDELCNQICGLLINIHMEDRSKELEKKETDNSSLFKGAKKTTTQSNIKNKSVEDLLKSEDDLAIDESHRLEQYTLQKITMEWLNWNSQFFDYADEPYLFYLAELLSKSFNETKQDARLLYSNWSTTASILPGGKIDTVGTPGFSTTYNFNKINSFNSFSSHFDVYSPFRIFSDISNNDHVFSNFKQEASKLVQQTSNGELRSPFGPRTNVNFIKKFKERSGNSAVHLTSLQKNILSSLISNLANKELWEKIDTSNNQIQTSEKVLGQRRLRKEYNQNSSTTVNLINPTMRQLLDFDSSEGNYNEFREYYRKQTERTFQDEESKKVFMIINSFGGSVGNGITVHDALQFIKAGSLTLALGVAASAASLALAGGTIGERYVTEGCHTMIHQPECLTPDHSVLTDEGWLSISQVTKKHKVATLNKKGEISYQHPIAVHKTTYKGPLYIIKTSDVDLAVTTNHRMYISEFQNCLSYKLVEASSILNKRVCYKKNGEWISPDYQFILPSTELRNEKEIIVPMEAWLIFFGSWIASGDKVSIKENLQTGLYQIKQNWSQDICPVQSSRYFWTTPSSMQHCSAMLHRSKTQDLKNLSVVHSDLQFIESKIQNIKSDYIFLKPSDEKMSAIQTSINSYSFASIAQQTTEIQNPNEYIGCDNVVTAAQDVKNIELYQVCILNNVDTESIRTSEEWNILKISLTELQKKINLNIRTASQSLDGCKKKNKSIEVYNKQLWSYLKTFSEKKKLPSWVWNLSKRQCIILLKTLLQNTKDLITSNYLKDNCWTTKECINHSNTAYELQSFYMTTSEDLALDICRLIVHAGFSFYIEELHQKTSVWRINVLTSTQSTVNENSTPVVQETLESSYDVQASIRTPERIVNDFIKNDYDGYVYCLTVPNEVFYVQHNGIPVWTGNSQLSGQASDIWIDSQEIMKIRQEVANIYSLSTYRPRHKILRDLDRDFYLTASETIYYGLADEIASNEVMHEIIEMTSKVWDYHDTKQQTLLESRDSLTSGAETQTQN